MKNQFKAWIIVGVVLIVSLILHFQPQTLFTDKYTWYYQMAEKHYQIGHVDKTLYYLDKAMSINPNDSRAYLLMSRLYVFLYEYDKSLEVIEKIKFSDPINYYNRKGIILLIGNYNSSDALNVNYEAERMFENEPLFKLIIGLILFKNEDYNSALIYFEKGLEMLNNGMKTSVKGRTTEEILSYLYVGLGMVYEHTNEIKVSKEYYDKAININPDAIKYIQFTLEDWHNY